MLMLVHVGGGDFDALQAVLMRCRAMLTHRPCTQKTSMVYKAIFPLLWAWVYTTSAGGPGGPRMPLFCNEICRNMTDHYGIAPGFQLRQYQLHLKTKKLI